ncbi:MAG: hypothetical protein IID16_10900 [Candidatus Marinimicrobia bacterium]|nr:hypothetical protein [Candidatus Neomarinimicrobiota bacterium]
MSDLAYLLRDSGEWTIGWNYAMGEYAANIAIPHAVQSAITRRVSCGGKPKNSRLSA